MITTDTTVLALSHNDHVYLSGWTGVYDDATAKVGTVEGYALERVCDPQQAFERAIANGHNLAWTYADFPCFLHSDKEIAKRETERRQQQRAFAYLVHDGQEVMIEGRLYKVRVTRGNEKRIMNCDPISFIRV